MKHFHMIRKWPDTIRSIHSSEPVKIMRCEYEADFWEGPLDAGQKGRYNRIKCADYAYKGRMVNTARSVSYYPELAKAMGI